MNNFLLLCLMFELFHIYYRLLGILTNYIKHVKSGQINFQHRKFLNWSDN